MDYKQFTKSIKFRLDIFPTLYRAKDWLNQNFKSFDFMSQSGIERIIKEGNSYIQKRIDEVIILIQEKLEIMTITSNTKFNISTIYTQSEISKDSFYGAGLGIGAALLFSGPIGWLAIAGAAMGATYNVNRKKEEIAATLVSNSNRAASEIYFNLEPVIRKAYFHQKPIGLNNTKINSKSYVHLNLEQLQLKEFLDKRGINVLVHFTDSSNVNSILNYGLLSVEELKKRNIDFKHNDFDRLDGLTNYISLSITHPNTIIYRHYKKTGRINNTSIIYIDASILYEEIHQPRFYCDRNAAAFTCEKGKTLNDFLNLFKEEIMYNTLNNHYSYDRKLNMRADNETTDPQSEILFSTHIDKKYILKVKEMN
jgi:hypothetical protein